MLSNIDITTPALLFPAISLLLLAYTNRFLVIAQLTRSLYSQYSETEDTLMKEQISHLRHRIRLIRHMQMWGIISFICCTLAMMCGLAGFKLVAVIVFSLSLVALLVSLVVCLVEIQVSGTALNLQLKNLEKH